MRRLSAFILFLILTLSLGLGSTAHATEVLGCVEVSAALSIGHAEGDGDQVPADADRGYPHHHGECHGHHVGVPIAAGSVQLSADRRVCFLPWEHERRAGAVADPAQRPPQA